MMMPIFQQYLLVIGIFQGLLLACLLIFGSTLSNASRILGAWCLFLALGYLGKFITMDGELNGFSPLIGFSSFFPALYAAFLYVYCRHALIDRAFTSFDLLHFAPCLLCYLLSIDFFLSPPEVKLAMVLKGFPLGFLGNLTTLICFALGFIYLGLSARLIRKYQRQAKTTLAGFNPDIFVWLWAIIILDGLIWTLKLAGVILLPSMVLIILADVFVIVFIYGIAMMQWRNPTLFKIEQLVAEPSDGVDSFSIDDTSARSGALDDSIRSGLLQTVKQHMQEKRSYLDNQLTLSRLAEAVDVSTHHLSEVLNQQEGKNFYQFVNEYRIDYIREQLKLDQSTKILDLAMTAGFSSKSTFNAVFKQFTGLTPSQYRKQLIV